MSAMRPSVLNLETNDEIGGFGVPSFVEINHQTFWSHYDQDYADAQKADFRGIAAQRIKLEVGLGSSYGPADRHTPPDLGPAVAKLRACAMPGRDGSPPPCVLSFGSPQDLIVVFDAIKVRYSRFRADGRPIGAVIYAEATELRDEEKRRKVATTHNQANRESAAEVPRTPRLLAVAVAAAVPTFTAAAIEVKKQLDSVQDQVVGSIDGLKQKVESARDELAVVVRKLAAAMTGWQSEIEGWTRNLDGQFQSLSTALQKVKADVSGRSDQSSTSVESQMSDLNESVSRLEARLEELKFRLVQGFEGWSEKVLPEFQEAARHCSTDSISDLSSLDAGEVIKGLQRSLAAAVQDVSNLLDVSRSHLKDAERTRVTAISKVNEQIDKMLTGLQMCSEHTDTFVKGCSIGAGNLIHDVQRMQQDLQQEVELFLRRMEAAAFRGEPGLDKMAELECDKLATSVEPSAERVLSGISQIPTLFRSYGEQVKVCWK